MPLYLVKSPLNLHSMGKFRVLGGVAFMYDPEHDFTRQNPKLHLAPRRLKLDISGLGTYQRSVPGFY